MATTDNVPSVAAQAPPQEPTEEQSLLSQVRRREDALEKRERELNRRELHARALQALSDRGLPGSLADALSYEDAPAMEASLERMESAFRTAVQQGVEQRMAGRAPRSGEGGGAWLAQARRAAGLNA